MKAVRLHGERDLRYEDVPTPEPGPGEVLVRVRACGVCRTDFEVYTYRVMFYQTGMARVPITLCHEWSGEVVQVGADVKGFEAGDLVTGETGLGCLKCRLCLTGHHNICPDRIETGILNRDGAFAEFIAHPAMITHKFRDLSFEEAALAEPAACGVYAARRARITPADAVAVLGGGAIGQLAQQAARAFGARTTMLTSRSPEKLKLAEELGADAAVNARDQDVYEAAMDLTHGHGFDVVIEATGSISGFNDALRITTTRGRIALESVYERVPPGDIDDIVYRELDVFGCVGGPNVWDETLELMRRGAIRTAPLISRRLPLSRVQEALSAMEKGEPGIVKIVVEPP
jgi:L-iditol 2-dehydrogenase